MRSCMLLCGRIEPEGYFYPDSFPQKDAVRKMIGFFDDKKVGVVTSTILVKKKENFIDNSILMLYIDISMMIQIKF
jgi:cellulose synthase/poly-beta-1,6-N-acetylglucosamine synthase-like glycosyltransferase